jgi:NAD(P)-dependent dehydrogenase (short-subunit alcohol dehydrogenase family)
MAGTVVITGGAGALGSALVHLLAKRGRKVAAVDMPRAVEALTVMEEALAPNVKGYGGDVTTSESWGQLVTRIEGDLGPIDGAVLIAGGWAGGKPLHASDDATLSSMIASNVDTAYRSLRAMLPGMVARKSGSVVVIGSRTVERPWTSANASQYAASKAAVVAMAQAVAAEVLNDGVRINAVLPSTMDTPANRKAMPDVDPAIWVSTDSCARVIAFLLSDDSRDVSGAAVPVYGRA